MDQPLTVQLRAARGKRYYDLLRRIMADVGDAMLADAWQIRTETRGFTPTDIARLALKYDLNCKATCEWLEDRTFLPCGTWQTLLERGLTVRDILSAAREERT